MNMTLKILKNTSEFKRMNKQAQKYFSPAFVMQFLKTEENAPFRLGLTVSRKVGNAVRRNRAKRRLREMVREKLPMMPLGVDIVLIARREAVSYDTARMKSDFDRALKKLGAGA